MNALTRLTNLHASLLTYTGTTQTVSQIPLKQWLGDVTALAHELESIQPVIQQIVDVTDALALTGQLLGADPLTTLDADKMRCLLEPLCERLEWASEQIRQVF